MVPSAGITRQVRAVGALTHPLSQVNPSSRMALGCLMSISQLRPELTRVTHQPPNGMPSSSTQPSGVVNRHPPMSPTVGAALVAALSAPSIRCLRRRPCRCMPAGPTARWRRCGSHGWPPFRPRRFVAFADAHAGDRSTIARRRARRAATRAALRLGSWARCMLVAGWRSAALRMTWRYGVRQWPSCMWIIISRIANTVGAGGNQV